MPFCRFCHALAYFISISHCWSFSRCLGKAVFCNCGISWVTSIILLKPLLELQLGYTGNIFYFICTVGLQGKHILFHLATAGATVGLHRKHILFHLYIWVPSQTFYFIWPLLGLQLGYKGNIFCFICTVGFQDKHILFHLATAGDTDELQGKHILFHLATAGATVGLQGKHFISFGYCWSIFHFTWPLLALQLG